MDGTIVGHIDVAIGRDRQLLTLLGVAIDIDDQLVARAQHIVLGRGDVHLRLEGEALVIENITAENLLTLLLRLAEIQGVGTLIVAHHRGIVTIHPLGGAIHHHLLLAGAHALGGVVDLPQGTIVLAHAVLGITNGPVGSLAHARLLQLTGILLAHLLDLLESGTLLQEFGGDV